jgi:DNA-binding CsgD family transcriptional regulator
VNYFKSKFSDLNEYEHLVLDFDSKTDYRESGSSVNLFLEALNGPFIKGLSPQEQICLRLLGQGLSLKEIALFMNLSLHTIPSYIAKIKDKSGIHFKNDLVKLGHRYGGTCL